MLRVKLFRGSQRLFDAAAREVVLPSESGEVSVLDFHAPMLCVIEKGDVRIDGTVFSVRNGIARVDRNIVTILAH